MAILRAAPTANNKAWERIQKRGAQAKELVEKIKEETDGFEPADVLRYLKRQYIPSRAFNLAATIQSLPEYANWKRDKQWKHVFQKDLELAKNTTETEQAIPIMPDDIIKIIAHKPKAPHVIVAAFLWVSASRYGDLKWVRITTKQFIDGPEPLWLVLFNYRGSKGDPSGARGDQKAIFIPEVWLETLRLQLPKELSKTTEASASDVKVKVESEYMIKKAMMVANSGFTLHSARRGGCQSLVSAFTQPQIAHLALHSQSAQKAIQSTALYTSEVCFEREREKTQMAMSLKLLYDAKLISLSTMRGLFRARCEGVNTKLPALFNQEHQSNPLQPSN